MPIAMPTPTVRHNAAAQRFENTQDGHLAECCYRLQGQVLDLHHTEVPAALQGQGLAAWLVKGALDWARESGFRVRPSCSYVAAYMQRKPETQDLLVGKD
jgi:uncharacterized protein